MWQRISLTGGIYSLVRRSGGFGLGRRSKTVGNSLDRIKEVDEQKYLAERINRQANGQARDKNLCGNASNLHKLAR